MDGIGSVSNSKLSGSLSGDEMEDKGDWSRSRKPAFSLSLALALALVVEVSSMAGTWLLL